MMVGVLASCDGSGPTFALLYRQAVARGLVFGWVLLVLSLVLVVFGISVAGARRRVLAAVMLGSGFALNSGWWNGAAIEGCGEVHPMLCITSTLVVALGALGPWFSPPDGWSTTRFGVLVGLTAFLGVGYALRPRAERR
jgi:hypothetical protein